MKTFHITKKQVSLVLLKLLEHTNEDWAVQLKRILPANGGEVCLMPFEQSFVASALTS